MWTDLQPVASPIAEMTSIMPQVSRVLHQRLWYIELHVLHQWFWYTELLEVKAQRRVYHQICLYSSPSSSTILRAANNVYTPCTFLCTRTTIIIIIISDYPTTTSPSTPIQPTVAPKLVYFPAKFGTFHAWWSIRNTRTINYATCKWWSVYYHVPTKKVETTVPSVTPSTPPPTLTHYRIIHMVCIW
jgi:hypothetical protein